MSRRSKTLFPALVAFLVSVSPSSRAESPGGWDTTPDEDDLPEAASRFAVLDLCYAFEQDPYYNPTGEEVQNGCGPRARAMADALRRAGIDCHLIHIENDGNPESTFGPEGIEWGGHVAVLVRFDDNGRTRVRVIDAALCERVELLTIAEWFRRCGLSDDMDLREVPGSEGNSSENRCRWRWYHAPYTGDTEQP